MKLKKEVNVEKLIETFSDMADRESLLTGRNVSQKDLLMQIIGTIIHVAMEEDKPKNDIDHEQLSKELDYLEEDYVSGRGR